MPNTNTTQSLLSQVESALSAVYAAESAGKSASTINRKYRAFFAAQDALKASGAWL